MAKKGTKVTYITGNHDDFLRIYQPLELGNIELKEEHTYTTHLGKEFLIIHGDQFDIVTRFGKKLSILGDKIYTLLLSLNKVLNFFRSRLGYGYWSLAKYLKDATKKTVNKMSDYEDSISDECKRRGFDGIICGHIHKAEISLINGIEYHNCGDWVESITALVETNDGMFELIDWGSIERKNTKLLSSS
jgi:UDP-2,3-diacylglucosamine pyrophosphatase LpxH|tara:strand:- start:11701 stop:12267 length:567 start_codon:yes stop_codon:yes gene_type:complete